MLQKLLCSCQRSGKHGTSTPTKDDLADLVALEHRRVRAAEFYLDYIESCQIALVLQPYGRRGDQPPELKPEFREKWSDVVNQVLRLRPCLQPPKGLEQTPQGRYAPLISKSCQIGKSIDELTGSSHSEPTRRTVHVYDGLAFQHCDDDAIYGYW